MAGEFAGMAITQSSGGPVTDPIVQGDCRCLMLLEAMRRYLDDMATIVATGKDERKVQNATNLLGLNLITICEANPERMAADVRSLASRLGIQMHGIERSVPRDSKGDA